jgi:hypothetical protein
MAKFCGLVQCPCGERIPRGGREPAELRTTNTAKRRLWECIVPALLADGKGRNVCDDYPPSRGLHAVMLPCGLRRLVIHKQSHSSFPEPHLLLKQTNTQTCQVRREKPAHCVLNENHPLKRTNLPVAMSTACALLADLPR